MHTSWSNILLGHVSSHLWLGITENEKSFILGHVSAHPVRKIIRDNISFPIEVERHSMTLVSSIFWNYQTQQLDHFFVIVIREILLDLWKVSMVSTFDGIVIVSSKIREYGRKVLHKFWSNQAGVSGKGNHLMLVVKASVERGRS